MRIESHRASFEVHKRALFKWALEEEGLENAQIIVGLHASRGIIELLSILLHTKNIIDEGFQINHRWFKSNKVREKFPEFKNKETIIAKMVELENLCETLAYGTEKPIEKTEEAIKLFKELEDILTGML